MARESIAKVPNQELAKRAKCFSFFLLLLLLLLLSSSDGLAQYYLYHGVWADERCRLSIHQSYTLGYINIPWVVVNYIK